MPKFHPLTVKDVKRETEDTVSVAFDVPAELAIDYTFKQGQYLTFKKEINGEELRRSYSICRSPLDGELRVAIKKVDGGKFSTYANESLKVGDVMETMTPMGRFYTEINAENAKNYVAFAAGSGITPVMAHMRTVLQSEPKSNFTLVYGNKTTSSIVFREEIEDLKNEYMDRLKVFHILSREENEIPIFMGRIDEEKCGLLMKYFIDPETIDEVFVCGPAPMIDAVKAQCANAGLDRKQVHFELFTSPAVLAASKSEASRVEQVRNDGFVSKVKIILDGIATEFTMDAKSDNILDAAMKQGADLPYACKGGVCATCRAKIDQGTVRMDINYGLEPDELERGFVLTCQAHPTSSEVVVNFDEA